MFAKKKIKSALSNLILELYTFNRIDQCWSIRIDRSHIDVNTMKLLVEKFTIDSKHTGEGK